MHTPDPLKLAREALDPLYKFRGALSFLESTQRTNSRDVADWRDDVDIAIKTLSAAMSAAPAEPATQFDDPRVQTVYSLLCNAEDAPPPEQHWEGWIARRIVDALSATTAGEPVALMSLLEEAFSDGFCAVETYNDTLQNSVGEAWEKASTGFAKKAAALSAPAPAEPAVPDGWRLVPVEPTQEMLTAADDGDDAYTLRTFGPGMQRVMQGPYDHWSAMLAAAPTSPKE